MVKDYLIVGQGLAGSFLSWNLLRRNKSIAIIYQDHENCSSLAAAGMINPITGKRLVLSQRCEELLPYAKEVYHELERLFNKIEQLRTLPINHDTKPLHRDHIYRVRILALYFVFRLVY